jgi:hypothetical protein
LPARAEGVVRQGRRRPESPGRIVISSAPRAGATRAAGPRSAVRAPLACAGSTSSPGCPSA